jgi:hypothetical protein
VEGETAIAYERSRIESVGVVLEKVDKKSAWWRKFFAKQASGGASQGVAKRDGTDVG